MLSVERTFTTSADAATVYAYLADFTNAESWDPGTVSCTRVDGDGGVGTRYRNVSKFLGRSTELDYLTRELIPGELVHFQGSNDQFTGHDRLRLSAVGTGTRITYDAAFNFRGVSKLAVPLVKLYLPRLADKTIIQLSACLDALA